jgi:hypothetical protein
VLTDETGRVSGHWDACPKLVRRLSASETPGRANPALQLEHLFA